MKKSLLISVFSIIILFFSCKKDKDQDPSVDNGSPNNSVPQIIADSQTGYQLEVVTLTSANINFSQSSYQGTFGSTNISLQVIDNVLGFQIPELPVGTYTMQTTIEGSTYNFSYTVQALPVISNPSNFVQTNIDGLMNSQSQISNLNSAMSGMYGAADRITNETKIATYYTNFQTAFANASPTEIADLAKFIAANSGVFSSSEDLILNIDSLNGSKLASNHTIEAKWNELDNNVKNRVKVIAAVGITSFYGFATGNVLFGAAAGLVGIKKIYDLNNYLIIQLDKNLLQFGNTLINDVQKTAAPITDFENGKQYVFDIRANYRNLCQQDLGSNSSLINSILSSLNKFESVWNKVISWVPFALDGVSFHIKNVANYHQKTFRVNAQYLSIVNISNQNVTAAVNNSSGLFKVTFNTTQSSNQTFNYQIKYINPNVNTTLSSSSGTVVPMLLPNTAGFGNIFRPISLLSSSISGDSTGWVLFAENSQNNDTMQCIIRTEGPTLPAPGNYSISGPGPLSPGQALVILTNNNGLVGGFAGGGILKVALVNNKLVYTFNNISFPNTTQKGSANITLP